MNILFYDCEIVKMIPDRTQPNDPEYEYCNGWTDYKNMGISVIGYCSSKLKEYGAIAPTLDGADFNCFQNLVSSHDIVVGFNSRNFDDNLCAANGMQVATGYDLLEETRLAAFGSRNWQNTPKGCSYSLGALAQANGGAKTGSGELAPKLWQEGKYQEVVDYCINDVRLTVKLFELGIAGKLIDPNTGQKLTIRQP